MSDTHVVADQSAVADWLADPATHGGQAVERIDTHGAMVFLAGERVYKVKRAVVFPYMDFSTLARRKTACDAEVRLNRRTAPALYLGVLPIRRRAGGGFAFGGLDEAPADAVEWAVLMRRFPQAAIFDRLAAAGGLTPDLMRDLAEAIAAFHGIAELRVASDAARRMGAVVEGNLADFGGDSALFPPDDVAELAALSRTALGRHGGLLDGRGRAGRVRRCHGDLHLRNICLIDGRPTLFDAIEFNDDLAIIDTAYDLAFLLMDLDHRDLRRFAAAVLNRYLECTGDYGGLALLPLFLSARAAVLAKVRAAMAAVQPNAAKAAEAESLRAEARVYLARARAYLKPPPPRLLVVAGLSGTGKTTLARALAPLIGPAPGAVVLRSDVIRKHLAGTAETEPLPPEGYGPEMTARVYDEICARAAAILAAGHAVIADAVFARPAERAAIEAAAARAGVPFDGLWLEAPPDTLTARVTARLSAGTGDASDANAEVVAKQLAYDLGDITWPRVAAGDTPEAVQAAAADLLGLAN